MCSSPLQLITRCLAVFAIAVSANAYIIGPAAVFLILILCLRWYYLRTSRQLKNLESFGQLGHFCKKQANAPHCSLHVFLPPPRHHHSMQSIVFTYYQHLARAADNQDGQERKCRDQIFSPVSQSALQDVVPVPGRHAMVWNEDRLHHLFVCGS